MIEIYILEEFYSLDKMIIKKLVNYDTEKKFIFSMNNQLFITTTTTTTTKCCQGSPGNTGSALAYRCDLGSLPVIGSGCTFIYNVSERVW